MLTESDYIVRLIPLPPHVKAMTVFDENGFANIYVNDQLSTSDQYGAIAHELRHVIRDDAYNSLPIWAIEQ